MVDIDDLLGYISPSSLDYTEWIQVGMALKHEGLPCSLWDDWSRNDSRYHVGECEKKWNSFHGGDVPVTGGTIYEMALRYGYKPANSIKTFDWDDDIGADKIIDSNWIEEKDIPRPRGYKNGENKHDLIRYLQAVFQPEDHVNFVVDSWNDADSKWKPKGNGTSARTAGELIESLTRCNSIDDVIGSYKKEAGAWIRFNPMKHVDGQKPDTTNNGVADLRYALIESDSIDIEKQYAIISELELPVAAIVHSGGKSLHAIVRVDANNMPEYKSRVNFLYDVCNKNGLVIDSQNRNPSRLSRMPGISRGDKLQFLVCGSRGKSSWTEWKEWVDASTDDLPDIEHLSDVFDNPPDLKPCMIEGLLRQGHKMILCGPSKAGKSFALIQLAICIAEGRAFLRDDWICKQGKVLYVNLELDSASCVHRLVDSYKQLGFKPDHAGNVHFWNLRGCSKSMDKLLPNLIRRTKGKGYQAVIIDPIYKVITGDENNASEMAAFCNLFDRITNEVGCSVIYCHHHSKGGQGTKSAMDRASGSGVFARDPDAMIDMIQLDPNDVNEELGKNETLWRLSMTLREFATPEPFEVIYNYPTFREAKGFHGAGAKYGADQATLAKRAGMARKNQKNKKIDTLHSIVSADFEMTGKYMSLTRAAELCDTSARNVRNWVNDSDGYMYVKNGHIHMRDAIEKVEKT